MKWLNIKRPITKSYIDHVESQLKISLPYDYKEKIGPINGGALRDAYITVAGMGDVPYSRNVSLHSSSPGNIFDLIEAMNEDDITLFPFGSVGNGDYFCFDFESNRVVLWQHETHQLIHICQTFTQLLENIFM